ncbi:aminotransferase class III-fold pyridoxal phosphate-dependent enzyme, partial [Leifsonia sp. SIMBA_070]|uniref:aminotransferase class III-fold pyridoxal phosphate-dependent enzyme n=1 Tax=Leifsonia sp. SIMBA_070 TaxID=3085810 RepID=UPI00397C7EC7
IVPSARIRPSFITATRSQVRSITSMMWLDSNTVPPPSTYWPEIQRICRKYDILLVADEVIGGFGRTGEWFAHQHFGFEPDLITMAKGLTSG